MVLCFPVSWAIAETTWLSCTIQPSCFYSLPFLQQEDSELCSVYWGKEKRNRSCRHLSTDVCQGLELELWILIAVLECNRGCRSSRAAVLNIFLATSGWFCQYVGVCSEVSNVARELRRICVPLWAVCASELAVFSLNSGL